MLVHCDLRSALGSEQLPTHCCVAEKTIKGSDMQAGVCDLLVCKEVVVA